MKVSAKQGLASNQEPQCVKNKQGEIVGAEKDVLEVWAKYFKELLNPKTNVTTPEETIYFGPKINIIAPTLQETLGVIRNLKNNRAPGEDSITSELIKYGGRKLWNRIHQLIQYGKQNRCPKSGAQP